MSQLLIGGVVGKTIDMFSFLFKTHVLQHMDSLENLFKDPDIVAAKRRFMGDES